MSNSGFGAMFQTLKPNFYKKIAFLPFSQSLKYLLIFVLVLTVILSLKLVFDLNSVVDILYKKSQNYLPEMFSHIPEIKIEAGQVSSPVVQPYIFEKDHFSFILDTTGKIKSLDDYKEGLLLTKNKILIKVVKDGGVETEVNEYDLAKLRLNRLILRPGDPQKEELLNLTWGNKDFSVTPDGIKKFAFKIILFLFPLIILFNFFYFMVVKLFQIVFFSLISLIVNAISGAKLKYVSLLNIGAYAITVPTLFSAALILSTAVTNRIFLVLWPLAYITIYIVFLSLAINKCKEVQPANPV